MMLNLFILLLVSCGSKEILVEDNNAGKVEQQLPEQKAFNYFNEAGSTIEERFLPPVGFMRGEEEEASFASFLRQLPLKSHGAEVYYYDGTIKKRQVHDAVVAMDIGNRDLQQCADAIIRLRAEYWYQQGAFEKIHFNFTNGFQVDYQRWIEGYRVAIEGNNTYWVKKTAASNTYEDFRKYLDIVFAYAGTLSLSAELEAVEVADMGIGDVFIIGGSPGHAVIVVDMVENQQTGEKLFLLAQSYMPAQEIHILKNPTNEVLSPWYSLDFGEELITPEWKFTRNNLKRF